MLPFRTRAIGNRKAVDTSYLLTMFVVADPHLASPVTRVLFPSYSRPAFEYSHPPATDHLDQRSSTKTHRATLDHVPLRRTFTHQQAKLMPFFTHQSNTQPSPHSFRIFRIHVSGLGSVLTIVGPSTVHHGTGNKTTFLLSRFRRICLLPLNFYNIRSHPTGSARRETGLPLVSDSFVSHSKVHPHHHCQQRRRCGAAQRLPFHKRHRPGPRGRGR